MDGRKRKQNQLQLPENSPAKIPVKDQKNEVTGMESSVSHAQPPSPLCEDRSTVRSGRDEIPTALFPPGYFADFLEPDITPRSSPSNKNHSSTDETDAVPGIRQAVTADLIAETDLHAQPSCNIHAQIADENCGSLETRRVLDGQQFGNFLQNYWDVIRERNGSLEFTSCAVLTAVRRCYRDHIDAAKLFAKKKLKCSDSKPCDPNMSLEEMQKLLRLSFLDGSLRQTRFASLLPGVSHLSISDREKLMQERRCEIFLIHRGAFISQREYYYGIGANHDVHPCSYFLRKLNVPDQENDVATFVEEFKRINLNDLERYVFLCIALFRPDCTSISDRAYLEFLYIHYMDLLRYLLSNRPERTAPFNVQGELDRVLDQVRLCSQSMLKQWKTAINTDK